MAERSDGLISFQNVFKTLHCLEPVVRPYSASLYEQSPEPSGFFLFSHLVSIDVIRPPEKSTLFHSTDHEWKKSTMVLEIPHGVRRHMGMGIMKHKSGSVGRGKIKPRRKSPTQS